MTVEEGVKLVISGGIVSPPDAKLGAKAEPETEEEDESPAPADGQADRQS